MKKTIIVVSMMLLFALGVFADDSSTNAPAKPYPLKTCLVCDMDLGTEKPFIFVYQGQEIKLCDKSEKADFDKEPDKYMKKLADEEARLKK
jgi:YHS domain-containing protein